MTKVVNIRNAAFDVYIGRGNEVRDGYFGNPYPVADFGRDHCIKLYSQYFHKRLEEDPEFKSRVLELKNKTLGCFCVPQRCHGHVIAEYLDNKPPPQLNLF